MAKLVSIGDSLTQGFQNFAVANTDLSFPAMIARCIGVRDDAFLSPDFSMGGGLPFNLEAIARRLESRFGPRVGAIQWPAVALDLLRQTWETDRLWERGAGAQPGRDLLFHNSAVWGFKVADAYALDARMAYERAAAAKRPRLPHVPTEARSRTAWRVLNPARVPHRMGDTQIRVAQRIKERDGKIDNLIVWLGANNCLATVVRLDASAETGDSPPPPYSTLTLWRPSAFREEYRVLADAIAALEARNVYVATVPHVTIAPIAYGIMNNGGELPPNRVYFDKYVSYISRTNRSIGRCDRYLTGDDAKKIDRYVDEYNECIRAAARTFQWHVVDTCAIADGLAYRRNHGQPTYKLNEAISDLDTRFLRVDRSGRRTQGGLVSWDGLHPTTVGYAIVAQEFISVMRAQNPGARDIDFQAVRAIDTLVARPPTIAYDLQNEVERIERALRISHWAEKIPLV